MSIWGHEIDSSCALCIVFLTANSFAVPPWREAEPTIQAELWHPGQIGFAKLALGRLGQHNPHELMSTPARSLHLGRFVPCSKGPLGLATTRIRIESRVSYYCVGDCPLRSP